MKKTGIVILALVGLAAAFLYPSANSNRRQSGRAQTHNQKRVLHQIPARVTSKIKPAETQHQPESNQKSAELTPEELLARLVGKWEQTKSTSRQILTINENGTTGDLAFGSGQKSHNRYRMAIKRRHFDITGCRRESRKQAGLHQTTLGK